MKTRSISDDDKCGGCKYRLVADAPDDGDRCVHDFAGVYEEDEDGTIKICHDFERPKRVLIIGGGPTSAAAVTALASAGFDIEVEAGPGASNGLATTITFCDESTTIKAPPRLGMTTPFYWRGEDRVLAQHLQNWRKQISSIESVRPEPPAERPKWGTSELETAVARAKLDAHYSAENHRRIIAGLDAATERMTGMRPEHGMPYANPLGPQPMKPKPNKAKVHTKKRARIAAQSRRRNRK